MPQKCLPQAFWLLMLFDKHTPTTSFYGSEKNYQKTFLIFFFTAHRKAFVDGH